MLKVQWVIDKRLSNHLCSEIQHHHSTKVVMDIVTAHPRIRLHNNYYGTIYRWSFIFKLAKKFASDYRHGYSLMIFKMRSIMTTGHSLATPWMTHAPTYIMHLVTETEEV